MPVRKSTHNTLRHLRQLVFWLARAQPATLPANTLRYGLCPQCLQVLLPNRHWSDANSLTVEHTSGSYEHRNRREAGEPAPVVIMHGSCHKRMTLLKNWQLVHAN